MIVPDDRRIVRLLDRVRTTAVLNAGKRLPGTDSPQEGALRNLNQIIDSARGERRPASQTEAMARDPGPPILLFCAASPKKLGIWYSCGWSGN